MIGTPKFCPTCGKHKDAPKMKPEVQYPGVEAWPMNTADGQGILVVVGGLFIEIPPDIVMESKRVASRSGKNNIIRVECFVDEMLAERIR